MRQQSFWRINIYVSPNFLEDGQSCPSVSGEVVNAGQECPASRVKIGNIVRDRNVPPPVKIFHCPASRVKIGNSAGQECPASS